MGEELLTLEETAAMLRVPVQTLRWWRQQGTGPAGFRLGRRVMYRRVTVGAWVKACEARDTLAGVR